MKMKETFSDSDSEEGISLANKQTKRIRQELNLLRISE